MIVANHQSAANEHIQTQQLNGHPLHGFVLTHDEIVKGGKLQFEMGPAPESSGEH